MRESGDESRFIEKITQIIQIGEDILPNDPLYTRAKEYIFGFMPTDERVQSVEEMVECMIDSLIFTIRCELDAIIGGGIPRTPAAVAKRLQEYKKWRVRFACLPRIHVYDTKEQKHGQHWLLDKTVSNEWIKIPRLEARWLYEKCDTLHATKKIGDS